MPAADNNQIQRFVNQRVRVRCEQIRNLLLSCEEDKSLFDDIYAALTNNPTWSDNNIEAPHLMTKDDVLAWNTFISNLIAAQRGDAQLPIILKGCVRSLFGS